MKYLTITVCFLLLMSTIATAQKRSEDLKAYKTAYLTEQLDLSPEEAEKFWPVYNSNQKEIKALKYEYHKKDLKKIKESGGIDALSDAEAKKFVENNMQYETKLIQLKKDFYKKLNHILSPKKILKLNKAEHDFGRKLLHQYRKRSKLEEKGN